MGCSKVNDNLERFVAIYCGYMDRIRLSEEQHQKLLRIAQQSSNAFPGEGQKTDSK